MPGINELLKPRNDLERELDKIESLVHSGQIAIQDEMRIRGVGQVERARRLGMTTPRPRQVVGGSGSRMTLETIGNKAHVLDARFGLVGRWETAKLDRNTQTDREA